MGLLQYFVCGVPKQGAAASSRHFRCRLCLLKGCERSFQPRHPRCRYCSAACVREAKRWNSWRWRTSEEGKDCRRQQSQRYRQRGGAGLGEPPSTPVAPMPTPSVASMPALPAAPSPSATDLFKSALPATEPPPTTVEPVPPVPSEAVASQTEPCEGHRIDTIPENCLIRPCIRPGCYDVFGVRTEYSPRRFCCSGCCKALGRVREREARYQRRREAGVRPRCRRARPTPKPRK